MIRVAPASQRPATENNPHDPFDPRRRALGAPVFDFFRSVQGRLVVLGTIAIAAQLVLGWFAYSTVEAVRINGSAYQRIDTQKDLINDLSPPALNVVRSMLAVTGVDPGDRAEVLAVVIDQLEREKSAFRKSEAAWRERLPDGPERTVLMERVVPQGAAFYDIVERELIPALRGGAKEKERVNKIVNERLTPLSKQQVESVRVLVEASERRLKQEQDQATELVDSRRWTSRTTVAVSVAFVAVVVVLTVRTVRARTAETISAVQAIASGDFARRMVEGTDEFGRVGRYVNEMAEMLRQVAEINKSQAIIEFKPDGSVVTANAKFLYTMGYSLDEIRGQHHRLFVEPAHANSAEYREFWARLGRGEVVSGEFRRVGKGGKDVWLQASYNPIQDRNGQLLKVIKSAADVTEQVKLRLDIQRVLKEVGQNSSTLASASQELTAVSQQMAANAEETAAQAGVASAAAEQVSSSVTTVATATEEMGASIKEIARNANEAAKVATAAVKVAERTNTTVAKLGESSAEIGNVVKVITSIAQQTNLLALNATIEAARAGEAGKGFAVVANEVKELAKQTAKATEDISGKIEAIQADTKGAVEAIEQIGQIINQINDIQNTIASAVEEQTATTGEISRNVAEAAKGSSEIAQNVGGVAQAARSTTEGASDTKKSADELSKMALALQHLVGQFKY
jgi:methyl-accepting chemotaxis protein